MSVRRRVRFVFATVLEYQPAVNFCILLTQPVRFFAMHVILTRARSHARTHAQRARFVLRATIFYSMIIGLWGIEKNCNFTTKCTRICVPLMQLVLLRA
jgi:hypothetical protein